MNIALLASGALRSRKEATWLTLLGLAKEYQEQGHHAIIVAEKRPELPEQESVEGVIVYRKYKGILSSYKTLKELSVKGMKLDIIHGFSASPFMVMKTIFAGVALKNIRKIHTIKSYSRYRIARISSSLLFQFVHAITVPTMNAQDKLPYIIRKKASVIRSNIDIMKFKPRDKEELKRKHNYSDKKIVLYYGAIRKKKGVDFLIKAIPSVMQENNDVKFIFAIRSRSEDRRDRYLAMARKLQCEQHLKIILDDLPIEEYVSMAEMVVLAYPTLIGTEGNPSCLLESMAAKTPVVTTDLPELREIVTAEEDVLMAKPGDVQSLAGEIKRLLKEPDLGKKLAENAYPKSKQFDTKVIAQQFLWLYK